MDKCINVFYLVKDFDHIDDKRPLPQNNLRSLLYTFSKYSVEKLI